MRLSNHRSGATFAIVVWAAVDGGELLVLARRNSRLVTLLHQDPRMWVARRTPRNVLETYPRPFVAYGRVDDTPEGLARVCAALSRKYGRAFTVVDRLGEILRVGRRARSVCLALRFGDPSGPGPATHP